MSVQADYRISFRTHNALGMTYEGCNTLDCKRRGPVYRDNDNGSEANLFCIQTRYWRLRCTISRVAVLGGAVCLSGRSMTLVT